MGVAKGGYVQTVEDIKRRLDSMQFQLDRIEKAIHALAKVE